MIAAAEIAASDRVPGSYPRWWRPAHTAYERISRSLRGTANPGTPNASIVRMITMLAALATVMIAAIPPISYFLAVQARLRGAVEIQTQLYVSQVAAEARQNPVFWNALADSATERGLDSLAIGRRPEADESNAVAERRRVFSGSGQILIDTTASTPSAPPAWPVLITRLAVMDGPTRLGEVDLARSLRPALKVTIAVASGSSSLGLLLFLLLRVAPLRMLTAAIEHASFLSAHDLLTGLPNRRLFHDRLEQALAQARRNGGQIGVFYMDLDHFKTINDLLGHPAGDMALRTVAERLRPCLRANDTLARLGGDEFAVIQPMLRRMEDANVLGQRLLAAVAPPIDLDGQLLHVGISIGVALSDIGASDQLDQLMKQADMALYHAKEEGRGQLCFFASEMNVKLRQRHIMETDLRTAISEQSLTLHYQPQVDLLTGRVLGAEALLRWNRPGHGMVPPDRFIGVAEDTGLIVPIGIWVLREACRRATTWPEHIGIAINVSPVQLRHAGFCEAVINTIRETGITPSRIELEITECVLMEDTAETLATLQRLRNLGARLAMDDFGTGYSSLGYLRKFRFDRIKIDRSFISRLGHDPNADAIVRAVVGMTEALGVRAIAEGVETSIQADVLRAHGCSEAQGFLYSRPVTGEAFDALVRQDQMWPSRGRALGPQALMSEQA
jgi:diguanylate cyclase (GGDEF)-like protein